MSKWSLAIISLGLLFITMSEVSQNKIIYILTGFILCGIGYLAFVKSKKSEEK